VKTTLEFPDKVFRKAKARAAERGIPLRQLVTEALEKELRETTPNSGEKPWMKSFGALRHLHKENVRIQKIIDEEFETIDPEDWV
jgi:hypothetical protein